MREEGFENALELFPTAFNPKTIQPEYSGVLLIVYKYFIFITGYISGKMLVLDYILAVTKSTTCDKVRMINNDN